MRSLASSERWTNLFLAAMGLAPLGSCGGVAGQTGDGGGSAGAAGSSPGGSAGVERDGSSTPSMGGSLVGESGAASRACETPTEQPGGFVMCADGSTHRPRRADCPNSLAPNASTDAGANAPLGSDAGLEGQTAIPSSSCATDADCVEKPYGRCQYATDYPGPSVNTCEYGCVRDEDCSKPPQAGSVGSSAPDAGSGFYVCLCGPTIGQCVISNCQTDDDCASGSCSSYNSKAPCLTKMAFACRTASDTCTVDADCADSFAPLGGLCDINGAGVRACASSCGIGRPFLVDRGERLANRDTTPGWAARATPDLRLYTAAERSALCEAWTGIALMEHASIAAFARFTMQLMSVAAPASLIESSMDAMRDETRHAKLAFGLATAFGGSCVGPGGLNIDGSLDASDLASIVVTTIHEGCVGETLAAMEATAALDGTQDAAVHAVLVQVARDETRHAELAWQFVRWAIAQAGEPMRVLVRDTLAEACVLRDRQVSRESPHAEALWRGGVLPDHLREEVCRVALRDVIAVCGEQLCRAPARAASTPRQMPALR